MGVPKAHQVQEMEQLLREVAVVVNRNGNNLLPVFDPSVRFISTSHCFEEYIRKGVVELSKNTECIELVFSLLCTELGINVCLIYCSFEE